MNRLITILLCLLVTVAKASINVTNYGAVGDLATITNINTISNSASLVCPGANFVGTDAGKLIEVTGGGNWQGASNDCLYAYISTVSSPSNIVVSVASGANGTNLTGMYGTDCQPCFSNAIAACASPTDTLIIPAGNYFCVPPDFKQGVYSGNWPVSFAMNRGGITFMGQGTATLTSASGWKRFGSSGYRGTLFTVLQTLTNNYPLIFTNLTLDGGITNGNIHNEGSPIDPTTGIGWDSSHHWLLTEGVATSGGYLNRIVMLNCTVQHWRGESMESTESSPNLYLCATNCFFWDINGSCINNFAHACESCTFSNANQAEEFYRAWATNISYMADSVIEDMNGAGMAPNGATPNCPEYIITNTYFALGASVNGVLLCPACNMQFWNCPFSGVGSSIGFFFGSSGGQGAWWCSNIWVIGCTFTNVGIPTFYAGLASQTNSAINVGYTNCHAAGDSEFGWGYSFAQCTNVSYANCSGSYLRSPFTSGQLLIDAGGNTWAGIPVYSGGTISDSQSTYFKLYTGGGSVYVDDTNSSQTVTGSHLGVYAGSGAVTVYPSDSGQGTPVALTTGNSATWQWNGSAWVTNYGAAAPPPQYLWITR